LKIKKRERRRERRREERETLGLGTEPFCDVHILFLGDGLGRIDLLAAILSTW